MEPGTWTDIAATVASLLASFAALWIAYRGWKKSDERSAEEERRRASERLASRLELIAKKWAVSQAMGEKPRGQRARERIRMMLLLVPDTDAVLLRREFGVGGDSELAEKKLAALRTDVPDPIAAELAEDIRRHSGLSPEDHTFSDFQG